MRSPSPWTSRYALALICKGWPHNVRPEGYYGTDITKDLLDRLTHPAKHRAPAGFVPPTLGIWELVLFYQAVGRHEEVRLMDDDYNSLSTATRNPSATTAGDD